MTTTSRTDRRSTVRTSTTSGYQDACSTYSYWQKYSSSLPSAKRSFRFTTVRPRFGPSACYVCIQRAESGPPIMVSVLGGIYARSDSGVSVLASKLNNGHGNWPARTLDSPPQLMLSFVHIGIIVRLRCGAAAAFLPPNGISSTHLASRSAFVHRLRMYGLTGSLALFGV
jgi:hypothetical protein